MVFVLAVILASVAVPTPAAGRVTGGPAGCLDIPILAGQLLGERGYSRAQAYVICSVAVDLRISNLVDAPNFTVSAFLSEDIFQP